MTNNAPELSPIPNLKTIPMLYRTRRFMVPLAFSFIVVFISFETRYPVSGVVSYAIVGMFLDWFYFRYKGYKDADLIGPEALQFLGITDQQLEQSIAYMVKSRIFSFAASILITTGAVLMNQVEDWQGTMIIAYITIATLALLMGKFTNRIVFPNLGGDKDDNRVWMPPNGDYSKISGNPLYFPASDSICYNPFARTEDITKKWHE